MKKLSIDKAKKLSKIEMKKVMAGEACGFCSNGKGGHSLCVTSEPHGGSCRCPDGTENPAQC